MPCTEITGVAPLSLAKAAPAQEHTSTSASKPHNRLRKFFFISSCPFRCKMRKITLILIISCRSGEVNSHIA